MNTQQVIQLRKTLPVEICLWMVFERMIIVVFRGVLCMYVCIYKYIYIAISLSFYFFRKEAADFYADYQGKPFYQ